MIGGKTEVLSYFRQE